VACGGSDETGSANGAGADGPDGGLSATGPSGSGAGGSSANATGGSSSISTGSGAASSEGLATKYPGDVGIENDPDVVFTENFERGSVDSVTARYEDFKNAAGMALVAEVPPASSGSAAIRMTAGGGGPSATDLFKNLGTGYDEVYLRYYVKYDSGVSWHHTSAWIGGYNPPSNYPSPQAGLKPNGDDRFSVSFEPITAGPNPRMDFYNYWMQMHSWMESPSGDSAYYGNALIHQNDLTVIDDQWMCIEIHIKTNPDAGSAAGAELGVWRDDILVQQFDHASPVGYWIRDKFCPMGADGSECTDYPPDPGTTMIPLDLQYRSTPDLKVNAFWPQNYITEGPEGSVAFDDVVIATSRIGCIK
jgi:hypothetical protein